MVESKPVLRALVNGAGPTGALTALALADAGWQVRISDPLSAAVLLERSRAYAFTHSSQRLLEQLGLWPAVQAVLVPFRSLQLLDLATQRQVPFCLADLGSRRAVAPGASVGWVGQHRPLMTLLLERLNAHPAITLELGTSLPHTASSQPPHDLIVAADGPHSPSREALGIGVFQFAYRQNCLTALVQLRGSADDQAWELLGPRGLLRCCP